MADRLHVVLHQLHVTIRTVRKPRPILRFALTRRGRGVPTLLVKGFNPSPPPLRLFATSFRITVRMSASISCLTPQWSGFSATQAMASPALVFYGRMGNEAKTIAGGLQN